MWRKKISELEETINNGYGIYNDLKIELEISKKDKENQRKTRKNNLNSMKANQLHSTMSWQNVMEKWTKYTEKI